MTQICMRKVADRRKVSDDGETQLIANLHGQVHGVIVAASLGPLHPVDDALSLA